jgi:hypothetical protein
VIPCPICQSPEREIFIARILAKYEVAYFFCEKCRFLHTEKPYWLDEAYSDAIVASDTGIVRRNLDASAKAAALFKWMYSGKGKYLDLAGGYGLFTRLMRDMGFEYYWSDPYASNLFARGFEDDIESGQTFRATTAFEVIEHLENPLAFIRSVFSKTKCQALLFSTQLYTGEEPPTSWWYYSRDSGQHISFFHRRTLETIAVTLELKLYSKDGIHLLSRAPVNEIAFSILTSRASAKLAPLLFAVLGRPKIDEDYNFLRRGGTDKPS